MKNALAIAFVLSVAAAASANEANEKLMAMSESDRHSAFIDMARKAGQCDEIVRSMLLGQDAKVALWTVGCRDGSSYSITVYADPQLKPFATSCENVEGYGRLMSIMERRTGRPQSDSVRQCWKKF